MRPGRHGIGGNWFAMSTGQNSGRAATSSGRRGKRRAGSGVFSEAAWAAVAQSLDFSGRELEIARGVFDDQTEFAIAAELGISPHTVHTHVERLHHKLRVTNRVQLVLRVLDEFLNLTLARHTKLPPICANWRVGACPLARPGG